MQSLDTSYQYHVEQFHRIQELVHEVTTTARLKTNQFSLQALVNLGTTFRESHPSMLSYIVMPIFYKCEEDGWLNTERLADIIWLFDELDIRKGEHFNHFLVIAKNFYKKEPFEAAGLNSEEHFRLARIVAKLPHSIDRGYAPSALANGTLANITSQIDTSIESMCGRNIKRLILVLNAFGLNNSLPPPLLERIVARINTLPFKADLKRVSTLAHAVNLLDLPALQKKELFNRLATQMMMNIRAVNSKELISALGALALCGSSHSDARSTAKCLVHFGKKDIENMSTSDLKTVVRSLVQLNAWKGELIQSCLARSVYVLEVVDQITLSQAIYITKGIARLDEQNNDVYLLFLIVCKRILELREVAAHDLTVQDLIIFMKSCARLNVQYRQIIMSCFYHIGEVYEVINATNANEVTSLARTFEDLDDNWNGAIISLFSTVCKRISELAHEMTAGQMGTCIDVISASTLRDMNSRAAANALTLRVPAVVGDMDAGWIRVIADMMRTFNIRNDAVFTALGERIVAVTEELSLNDLHWFTRMMRLLSIPNEAVANAIATHMTQIVGRLSGKQASIMLKALSELEIQSDAMQTAIAALSEKAGQDQPAQSS